MVTALKFEADGIAQAGPLCGAREQSIRLPTTFMAERYGTFDCAFMASSRNNFMPKGNRNVDRKQSSSDIVTVNIYDSQSSVRRRRLYEVMEHNTSTCFPYFITMSVSDASSLNLSMKLDESTNFPSCDFWNHDNSYWDTEGCFVYDITNDSVICGCTHLTTFSVSDGEIWPNTNRLIGIGWHELTFSNLIQYPVVWLTTFSLLMFFCILCVINPRSSRVHARSILAMEDIIYESVRREKLGQDILGKELKLITKYIPNHHDIGIGIKAQLKTKDDRISLCALQFKLYKVYLRSEV